jgi:hypothetical protein
VPDVRGDTMRRVRLAALVALVGSLAGVGQVAVARPDTCDRACVIGAANTYLAALVSHDGSQVPLAPDATRVENGSDTGATAEEIRAGLASPIMFVITGIRDLRWYVDGEHATAVYLLDTVTSPTYIVERFRVVDGLIHEIEAVFFIDIPGYVDGPTSVAAQGPEGLQQRATASSHGPLGPVPVNPGDGAYEVPAEDAREAHTRTAAASYLAAVGSGDPTLAAFESSATRTENRRPSGDSGPAIQERIDAVDADVLGPRIWVDGDQAVAIYELESANGRTWAATRLRAVGKAVAEVETVCASDATCGAPAA